MNENVIILSLFGGVFLLFYGIKLAGEGLKGYAGARIKTALETMTQNRVAGFATGIFITFLLQSSSATTVTVVSLIESGLMTFAQSLGVILGSDVGTTLTVQLISFQFYDYALFICGLGVMLTAVAGQERRRHLGEAVLGFGLIFLSIKLMSDAMAPLKHSVLFIDIISAVGERPFVGILVSALFTAIIHSSAATIGIAITLALQGLLGIEGAIPIVLGANIGTTATALIASARGSAGAKRAAVANVLFKVVGVVVFYPFIHIFADLMARTSAEPARQVANAHTVFNVTIGLGLLPFTTLFAKLLEGWFPEREDEQEEAFKPKYLNPAMLSTPTVALAQATREAMRMAEVVQDMLRLSLPATINCDTDLIARVEAMDDNVDVLDGGIRFYLTQLSKENLHTEEAARQMELLIVVSNLEAIGDVIDKNLMENARKKAKKCVQFSKNGQQDIQDLHGRVLENLELAVSAFTTRDAALAERVVRNKRDVRDQEKEYYTKHIKRLESGLAESYETSSIHLDVLTNLKRVNTHVTNIVYPLLQTQPVE